MSLEQNTILSQSVLVNEEIPKTVSGLLRRMAAELNCPICLGILRDPYSTQCNHLFCEECIHQSLQMNLAKCPLCKTPITKRGLNKMESTGELADAYQELLDSYEEMTGAALSQEKQHSEWQCEPIPNLSQAYPYPVKEGVDTKQDDTPNSPIRNKRRKTKSKGKAKMEIMDVDQDSGDHVNNRIMIKPEYSKGKNIISSLEKSTNSPHIQYDPSLSVDIDASQVEPSTQNLMLLQQLVSDVDVVLAELNNEGTPKIMIQNDTQDTSRESLSNTRCSSPDLFDSSEVASQNQDTQEMPVILGTMLKASQIKKMNTSVKKLNATIVTEFTSDVTHLVTEAVKGTSKRTMKYFLAILHGRWLVNYQWIEDSLSRNEWLDEDVYEVIGDERYSNYGPKRARQSIKNGEPKLFHNQQYLLVGEFKQPSRDDLITLLTAGGATIVDKCPPSNCSQQTLVICDNATAMRTKNRLREQYSREVVLANWVLDCISNYKLIDTSAY
ncbi:Breast cancer 1, early onset, variant 5 [Basidiobolus ranarum]|uniref:Breast cancer 1, early onset, variant 5 n=2 Tax=Basidiobolus ranarum TaxID=34480 RepID=A0ABR2WBP8_9FUNG